MRFYIPSLEIENALKLDSELKKLDFDELDEGEHLILDFSNMQRCRPLATLMVGSILRKFRSNFPNIIFVVQNFDSLGCEYAKNIGFFKYLSERLNIGKMPGEALGNMNYLPITKIDMDELHNKAWETGDLCADGELLENKAGDLSNILDRGNSELHKILTYLIREILRNIPEHAEVNQMWISGQYWPSYDVAEIGIIDEGIGIASSIRQNTIHNEYIETNEDALRWAIKAGISESFRPSEKQRRGDEWANSGFGLYMVKEICNYLSGEFYLISYDNYVHVKDNQLTVGQTYFAGTAIMIRVKTDKINDAQSLISKVARAGEEEARSIRNAFKNASRPSKGLIDSLL